MNPQHVTVISLHPISLLVLMLESVSVLKDIKDLNVNNARKDISTILQDHVKVQFAYFQSNCVKCNENTHFSL